MDILQAVVYGIVQGITEFLPISSTAHLVLVPWFMGWNDPGLSFGVALHLGTLAALLVYFRQEWIALSRALSRSSLDVLSGKWQTPNARLISFISIGTIPAAIVGVIGQDFIESTLRTPLVISFTLVTLALVLAVAEMRSKRSKELGDISWIEAAGVGIAQAFALVPGVSRSGVTITAGLFCGMTREASARFSFFLSTPIIAGAVVKNAYDIWSVGISPDQQVAFAVGIIVSGLVGYASIDLLLRFLQTRNTLIFVYYRIALGIAIYAAFV